MRDRGGDLKAGRKKICYLPGCVLPSAFGTPSARRALASEAACFFQDLEGAWPAEQGVRREGTQVGLLGGLDERLAAARPTFLSAAPELLPTGLECGLRARLPILELA